MADNISTTASDEGEAAENLITLLGEDGEQQQFAVLDIVEIDGREYALLLPVPEGEEEVDEEAGVFVLRFEDDDSLAQIEDEAEFEKVVKYLEEMAEEEDEEEEA